MTTLASLIRSALIDIDKYELNLESSLRNAVEISKRAILHEGDAPIAGIRGPPGTGKTKVMEGLMNDEDVINELLNSGYKFIYIAPTNELTISGFARALRPIIRMLQGSGLSIDKILSKIRIYGSAIPRPYFGDDLKELRKDANVSDDVLRKMVYGGIDDALFIFTTDYQRVSSRMRKSGYKFIPFIDEASKMPFYLPFNPISDAELRALAQGSAGIMHGLVIVGDDRQAVAVGPEYQGYGRFLLALPKVEEILRSLNSRQFMTLNRTFRLPRPTQQPISDGFYSDIGIQLKAAEDAKKRLEDRLKNINWKERLGKCKGFVNDYLWDRVVNSVEDALSSLIPIIMVNTKNAIGPGEYSEPMRVKLAAYYAILLRCLLGNDVGISVIGPYRDLVEDVRYYLRKIGGVNINVRFLTVQSMLGGEDDIVIALLGKEWSANSHDDEGLTIYFREPENLNVQFSRHRLMLIVIGDIQRLRNTAAKIARGKGLGRNRVISKNALRIRETLDTLFDLAEVNPRRNLPSKKVSDHVVLLTFLKGKLHTR
jgi:hypothetical protein